MNDEVYGDPPFWDSIEEYIMRCPYCDVVIKDKDIVCPLCEQEMDAIIQEERDARKITRTKKIGWDSIIYEEGRDPEELQQEGS